MAALPWGVPELARPNLQRKKRGELLIVPNLNIWIADKHGQVFDRRKTHNRIMDNALYGTRDLWGHPDQLFSPALTPNYIAVGTGTAEPTDGDTALGNEIQRNVFSKRTADGTTIIYQMFLATTEANGYDLTEAGVFDQSASGTLWLRAIYNAISKTSSISITYQWEITFTRV